VQSALLGQNSIPVDAVGCSTCQSTQHIVVQLHYFLHRLGTNILSRGGSRIRTQYHTSTVLEAQSGGAMVKIHANSTMVQDFWQILSGLQENMVFIIIKKYYIAILTLSKGGAIRA